MRWSIGYMILSVFLVLVGIFLPREWYDALPKLSEQPPLPIKGVTLLQISFVLEGLALFWLLLKGWTFTRLNAVERLQVNNAHEKSDADLKHKALWSLAAITFLAFFLRLWQLNTDLWLDEIITVSTFAQMPVLQVVSSYISSNNHLLNTILVKLAVTCFGEKEWAIRLPAMIFGTATIPAIYWMARLALSRRVSLAAALLLAVSYHHIFFSQNARGYSAYLLFSLLSSGLLIKGMQEDRIQIWVLYIVTMFLNFASLLLSSYVFISHILVSGIALLVMKRQGFSLTPLLKRFTVVFLVTAFLGFQLYATMLPQAYVVMQTVYKKPSSGYSPLSVEFLQELVRGISAGFGTGLVFGALPFLMIAGAGFFILFRRQWALTVALTMPGILTVAILIVKNLTFSPRLFLIALPLAILAAAQGVHAFAILIARILRKSGDIFCSRLALILVLVVCMVSFVSLTYYYSVPKQAYRASIQFLETERKSDEIIIVIASAKMGYSYYGKCFGLKESKDIFYVNSVEALDAVISSNSGKSSFLVTTLSRLLRLSYPDLDARIAKEWRLIRKFPGTIGNGAIMIWTQREQELAPGKGA